MDSPSRAEAVGLQYGHNVQADRLRRVQRKWHLPTWRMRPAAAKHSIRCAGRGVGAASVSGKECARQEDEPIQSFISNAVAVNGVLLQTSKRG